MTGYFVRVHRDGWENVEVDQLTDDELEEVFRDATKGTAIGWAISLARWIRDNVKDEPSKTR